MNHKWSHRLRYFYRLRYYLIYADGRLELRTRFLSMIGYPVKTYACASVVHDTCKGRIIFSQDRMEDRFTIPCRCGHHRTKQESA